MEELVLMSSVSMLSLIPLLTELLSSQLDTHTNTTEDRERLTLILLNNKSCPILVERMRESTWLSLVSSYWGTDTKFTQLTVTRPWRHSSECDTCNTKSTALLCISLLNSLKKKKCFLEPQWDIHCSKFSVWLYVSKRKKNNLHTSFYKDSKDEVLCFIYERWWHCMKGKRNLIH